MMPKTATRKERLNFRLDRQVKSLIEQAATTLGQSVTEFAVFHLVRDARTVLREQETTMLSDRDRQVFLSMLEADAQPNEALKRAAKIYRRQRA
jgi:uncharacterized protein (DUF1778 family)